jgi:hypothetical protein
MGRSFVPFVHHDPIRVPAAVQQPGPQPTVICLEAVIGVPIGAVPCRWQQSSKGRVDRRLIGCDGRDPGRADGPLEEPPGGLGVSARGYNGVDHLPELVDRAVDVAPAPSHLQIRLVHLPAVTDSLSARSGGVGQQRREPKHPSIDRYVVHLDTPLGEELLEVACER